MTYLPINQGYAQEREVQRLARLLAATGTQSPGAQAMGHMIAARLWSIDGFEPDGTIAAVDSWILEEAALWRGPEGKLIEAFLEVGFLRTEGDLLYFPDWDGLQGRVLAARKAGAEKKARWRAKQASETPSTGDGLGSPPGSPPGTPLGSPST